MQNKCQINVGNINGVVTPHARHLTIKGRKTPIALIKKVQPRTTINSILANGVYNDVRTGSKYTFKT